MPDSFCGNSSIQLGNVGWSMFGHYEIYEPPHDKTNKVNVRPAKTRISLGIRQVWSESSLSAWRKLGPLATQWALSEDSDQTGRMPRLIWVFAGRTCHFVGFVTRWLILCLHDHMGELYKDCIRLKECLKFFYLSMS